MLARSSNVSSTVRSYSAAVQRPRRPQAVMISISDIGTCSGICLRLHGYAKVSVSRDGPVHEEGTLVNLNGSTRLKVGAARIR